MSIKFSTKGKSIHFVSGFETHTVHYMSTEMSTLLSTLSYFCSISGCFCSINGSLAKSIICVHNTHLFLFSDWHAKISYARIPTIVSNIDDLDTKFLHPADMNKHPQHKRALILQLNTKKKKKNAFKANLFQFFCVLATP